MISVGPLDQVVGIQDDNDRAVVIRTGISPSDLSGKTWKIISAGKCEQPSLNLLNSTVVSAISRPDPEKSPEPKPQVYQGSSNANFKKTASDFGDRVAKNMATTIATGAVAATVGRIPIAGPIVTSVSSQIVREELSKVKLVDSENTPTESNDEKPTKSTQEIDESMYQSAMENPGNAEREKSVESDVQSIHSDNTTIFDREDHYGDELYDDVAGGPQWVWLTMGACKLDPSYLPASWFIENISSQQSLSGEAWRMNILQVYIIDFELKQ